ncbi:MAG: 2-C-methyl-D-erythritol 2,4-cyclodiphosphate synthase, partial [Candidatus Omnitrophica bacterium]|nr:2-C-methyl-D-erythritol 2,4-cyclodiphosphate synthase [Candidatus Omnitrophota bacterium]
MNLRVGHGTDIHRVKAGDGITLGGVKIPCEFALIGHSDADLVLHSLTDALLGAASMGDIGSWFPDDDPEYAGADSAELLKRVL